MNPHRAVPSQLWVGTLLAVLDLVDWLSTIITSSTWYTLFENTVGVHKCSPLTFPMKHPNHCVKASELFTRCWTMEMHQFMFNCFLNSRYQVAPGIKATSIGNLQMWWQKHMRWEISWPIITVYLTWRFLPFLNIPTFNWTITVAMVIETPRVLESKFAH